MLVNKQNLIFYSLGAIPAAFVGMPLYIFAPEFYASNFDISLTLIATFLLALRIIDALQDPLIGYFTDKYRHNIITIFAIGVVLLALGFVALFNPYEPALKFWFLLSVFLANTGFSIIAINLISLGAAWSPDYNDKTKIALYREAFASGGLILTIILLTYFTGKFSALQAYSKFSYSFLIVLVICYSIFYLFWLRNVSYAPQKDGFKFKLGEFLKTINKKLYLIFFLSIIASTIAASLVMFYIKDYLQLPDRVGLFLLSYFLAAILAMPIWQQISEHVGKITCWKISMLVAVLFFSLVYFIKPGDANSFLLICFATGAVFGAELSLPSAIIADHTKSETITTEFSLFTFLLKLALAVSVFLLFPVIEFFGYRPGQTNSEQALNVLKIAYSLVPVFFKLLAIFLLHKFFKQEVQYATNKNINSIDNGNDA